MILSFSVKNYLSYKEKATISFEASSIRDKKEYTFIPSFDFDIKLLKSLGLYGYNSSGKSNLIKALKYMQYAVLSSNNPSFTHDVVPFVLDDQNIQTPSYFEVIFFTDNKKYKYGFEILNNTIHSEWLFYTESKVRENHLFVRNGNDFSINKTWSKKNGNAIETFSKIVKSNTLFVSTLAQLNVRPIPEIIEWFTKIDFVEPNQEEALINHTAELMKDEYYKHNIINIIKNAHLGFDNIKINKLENKLKHLKYNSEFLHVVNNAFYGNEQYEILTVHNTYLNGEIVGTRYLNMMTDESAGTRKFFGLLGIFIEAIFKKKIVIIDELDSKFHSSLFEVIILFFNSPKFNAKGAQLFFTTHSTYLMKQNTMRRDQIYLLDKNSIETSVLERLHGGKASIRTDASIEKEYLSGNVGGTKQLDFDFLNNELDFGQDLRNDTGHKS